MERGWQGEDLSVNPGVDDLREGVNFGDGIDEVGMVRELESCLGLIIRGSWWRDGSISSFEEVFLERLGGMTRGSLTLSSLDDGHYSTMLHL